MLLLFCEFFVKVFKNHQKSSNICDILYVNTLLRKDDDIMSNYNLKIFI
jgi:hypothetical protein